MAAVAEEWDMLGGLEGIESLRRKITSEKRQNSREKCTESIIRNPVQARGQGSGKEKPREEVQSLLRRLNEIGI